MQDIQDSDERGGCGSRLDGECPRQPGCSNLHELDWWMGSGHREVGLVDTEPVWVRWKCNFETDALGKGVTERTWLGEGGNVVGGGIERRWGGTWTIE